MRPGKEREKAEFLLLDPLDKLMAMSEIMDIVSRWGEPSESCGIGIGKILHGIADEIYEIGQNIDKAERPSLPRGDPAMLLDLMNQVPEKTRVEAANIIMGMVCDNLQKMAEKSKAA